MNGNFTFKNFTPTRDEEQACRTIYQLIWKKSPSDSSITTEVEKLRNNEYATTIEIHSANGKFRSSAAHASLSLSVDYATSRFLDALSEWRSKRFEDEKGAVVDKAAGQNHHASG